jgi:hypothetical protein
MGALRLSDRRLLKGARRLRQDTSVQRGLSLEYNVSLRQDGALQMRACAHSDIPSDLPVDVSRQRTARKNHLFARGLHKVPRRPNDEDVSGTAGEGDIGDDVDICRKGVNTGRQSLATNEAAICKLVFGDFVVKTGDGGVRGIHVVNSLDQIRGGGISVVRSIHFASDLR